MSAHFGPGGNSREFAAAGYKSTLFAPAWVKQYGLDAYEYEASRGVNASLDTFKAIGEAAKQNGVKLSLHAPYFISLSGIEEAKRMGSIRYITESVAAAHALGAGIIVIHCGSASKISRQQAVNLAKDTLTHAIAEVEKMGIDDVFLGIETMGKVNQLGTLEEVIDICTIDPRLRPVVDFGHLNARECGLFSTVEDFKRVFCLIGEQLGDACANELHCHFSKIEYTSGGEKKHLTFEDTVFGPSPELFVEAVKQLKVSPTVICESDGVMDRDALYMKRLYLEEGV